MKSHEVKTSGRYKVRGLRYEHIPRWDGELDIVCPEGAYSPYAVMPDPSPIPGHKPGSRIPLCYEFWCFAAFELKASG